MADALHERLHAVLADRQFSQVAPVLDSLELESSKPAVLVEWPHALHMLGHIHNHDLEDARFLWKRFPAEVKQNNPELEAVWRLLQYLWNRNFQGVWTALDAYQWSAQVRPLVEAIADTTRQRMLVLLGDAYTLVTPTKAASLLGLSREEALALVQGVGWEQEEDAVLRTKRVQVPQPERNERLALNQLTDYLCQLES